MELYGNTLQYWEKRIGYIDMILLIRHRPRAKETYKSASEFAKAKGLK